MIGENFVICVRPFEAFGLLVHFVTISGKYPHVPCAQEICILLCGRSCLCHRVWIVGRISSQDAYILQPYDHHLLIFVHFCARLYTCVRGHVLVYSCIVSCIIVILVSLSIVIVSLLCILFSRGSILYLLVVNKPGNCFTNLLSQLNK